ncbi:ATP-binding protein [Myxococcota bacterium]|nr:ATP-binding protein [Myxococcota bacterium]
MIRRNLETKLLQSSKHYPVVTLSGPRQSGKTTLCRGLFPELDYVSLETPQEREFASEDPRGFLERYKKGAIFDEIQRVPELLSWLQGMVDDDPTPGRFILSGSENLALVGAITQSLAGRTAILHLPSLSFDEVCRFKNRPADLGSAIVAGGYPAPWDRKIPHDDWLSNYIATYVERDVRQILNITNLGRFRDFLKLVAGRVGQLVNTNSLANDLGLSHNTIKSWLAVLEASFLIFTVRPWNPKLNKRLVKTPKIYFWDSGLLSWLLGIRTAEHYLLHPLRGQIFESWVTSEIAKSFLNKGEEPPIYFFRDQAGNEVDLIIEEGTQIRGIEIKSSATVSSKFFKGLDRLDSFLEKSGTPLLSSRTLVYGGSGSYIRSGARIVGWDDVPGVVG